MSSREAPKNITSYTKSEREANRLLAVEQQNSLCLPPFKKQLSLEIRNNLIIEYSQQFLSESSDEV
jgi:hypothetical protein